MSVVTRTRSQQLITTTTTTTTVVHQHLHRANGDDTTTSDGSTSHRTALADLFDCVYALSESLFNNNNNSINNRSSSSNSSVTDEQRRQFKQVLEAAKSLALEAELKYDNNDDGNDEQQQTVDDLPKILQSTVDRYSPSLRLLSSEKLKIEKQQNNSDTSNGVQSLKKQQPSVRSKRTRDTSTKNNNNNTTVTLEEEEEEEIDNSNDDRSVVSKNARKKTKHRKVPQQRQPILSTNPITLALPPTITNNNIVDDDNNDFQQANIDEMMQEFVNAQPIPLEQMLKQFIEKYKLGDVEWLNDSQRNSSCNVVLRILQSMGNEFSLSLEEQRDQLTAYLDDATNLLKQSRDQSAKQLIDFLNQLRTSDNVQCAIQQLKLCHLATKALKQTGEQQQQSIVNNNNNTNSQNTTNTNTMHQRMFKWELAEKQYRQSKQQRWVTFVRLAVSVAEYVRDNHSEKRNFLDLTLESLNKVRTNNQRPLSYDVVKELHSLGNSLLQSDLMRECMQDQNAIGNRRNWQKANREEAFRLARPVIEYLLRNDFRWCEME